MYSGYLNIELANDRVRECRRTAEANNWPNIARQAQVAQTTKRNVPIMGSLLKLLRRKPKYGNAGLEIAAGITEHSGTLPQVSTRAQHFKS